MPINKTKNTKIKEEHDAPTKKGASKTPARNSTSKKSDHDSRPYEERTRGQLYEVAKELEIDGRSKMDKDQLIRAIRKVE